MYMACAKFLAIRHISMSENSLNYSGVHYKDVLLNAIKASLYNVVPVM